MSDVKFMTTEAITNAIALGNEEFAGGKEHAFNAMVAWLASYGAQLVHNQTLPANQRPKIGQTQEIMAAQWLAANKDGAFPKVLTVNGVDYVNVADRYRYDMAKRVFALFAEMQKRADNRDTFNELIAKGNIEALNKYLRGLFDDISMTAVKMWMDGNKPKSKAAEKSTGQKLASTLEKNVADTTANEQAELFAKLVNGVACGMDKETNRQILASGAAMAQKAAGGTTVARQVLDQMAASLDLESLNAIVSHAQQLATQVEAKLAELEAAKAEAEAAEASKAELAAKADEREQAAIAQAELDALSEDEPKPVKRTIRRKAA